MNNKFAKNHIILGVGANLAGDFGSPKAACGTALKKLSKAGVKITGRSFGRDRRYPIVNAFKGRP